MSSRSTRVCNAKGDYPTGREHMPVVVLGF
jgi:hypothetical protein